jgi:hypothetical protein
MSLSQYGVQIFSESESLAIKISEIIINYLNDDVVCVCIKHVPYTIQYGLPLTAPTHQHDY